MPDYTDLPAYQQATLDALAERGIQADFWHSGGGIVGLLIQAKSSTFFTTLDSDGGAYVILDWNLPDGDFVASIEIQVRPFGGFEFKQLGGTFAKSAHVEPQAPPAEIADAVAQVFVAMGCGNS